MKKLSKINLSQIAAIADELTDYINNHQEEVLADLEGDIEDVCRVSIDAHTDVLLVKTISENEKECELVYFIDSLDEDSSSIDNSLYDVCVSFIQGDTIFDSLLHLFLENGINIIADFIPTSTYNSQK